MNLDNILKEVAELNCKDSATIKEELFNRVKVDNYVPSGAETDYLAALFREYQRKFEPDKITGEKTEIHQHTKG